MSHSTRQPIPLKRKKRVAPNPAKPRSSVTSINGKRKPLANPTINSANVTSLGSRIKKIPSWLKSLRILENSSTLLAFCLVCTTLGVYGWTVLTQQTWSRQYRNLENLQRQERDFTAVNESLKHQLAEQSQSESSDLVPATPQQTLFLQPVNSWSDKAVSPETQQSSSKTQDLKLIRKPLGY